ncbi:MAG: hypothetical protein ACRD2I_24710, partial [Vicinamibacterales bacterium]
AVNGRHGSIAVSTRWDAPADDRLSVDIDNPATAPLEDEALWSGALDACRRVLEAHGGSLEVVRQQAGGVRFHLELPVTDLVENQGT